eukprot:scaffold27955_cov29-Tisochrysis_lutea.AAC.1
MPCLGLPLDLQVDLGGETHALEPLAAISRNFHVFTRPTLFRNALWLPYRCAQAQAMWPKIEFVSTCLGFCERRVFARHTGMVWVFTQQLMMACN